MASKTQSASVTKSIIFLGTFDVIDVLFNCLIVGVLLLAVNV